MVVTLTSLRLKSLWGFFILSWWGLKITLQARRSKGFVKMRNTGFGYMHYTASVWNSAEEARNFAHSGAHLRAMKNWKSLSTEIRILTFPGEELPSWADAKALLATQGRRLI